MKDTRKVWEKVFSPPCFGDIRENLECNLGLKDSPMRQHGCKLLEECTRDSVEKVKDTIPRNRKRGKYQYYQEKEDLGWASAQRRRQGV